MSLTRRQIGSAWTYNVTGASTTIPLSARNIQPGSLVRAWFRYESRNVGLTVTDSVGASWQVVRFFSANVTIALAWSWNHPGGDSVVITGNLASSQGYRNAVAWEETGGDLTDPAILSSLVTTGGNVNLSHWVPSADPLADTVHGSGPFSLSSTAVPLSGAVLVGKTNYLLCSVVRGVRTPQRYASHSAFGGTSRAHLSMAFRAPAAESVAMRKRRSAFAPAVSAPASIDLSANALAQAAATAALDVQAGGATVDLAAVGAAQAAASASLLKGVSLSSAGLSVATGGASMAHVVPLQASAVAIAQSGADLALGITLSASGLAQAAGAAALSTSSGVELEANGQAQATGGAVLSLVVNLSAAGVAQALSTAGLAQGVALAAAGAGQAGGSAALQVGAPLDLAAAGGAQASGGASLWLDVPLGAAALAQAAAAGSLQLSVPLGAAALAQAGGTAVLAGAVTLSAGGQVVATGGAALQVLGALEGVTKGLRMRAPVRGWAVVPAARVWQVRQRRRVWRMADASR